MISNLDKTDFQDDARWGSALLRSLLDHWWVATKELSGLFVPYLDRRWGRTNGGPLTLVSQCRLIYNFCRGYETFDDPRFAEAAAQGLTALQRSFRMGPGRYRWAVTHEGAEADSAPDAYGHAFTVLALATAARALGDATWAATALETWDAMAGLFQDTYGGLIWRPAMEPSARRSQNPLMHTFEALLALHSVDASGRARTDAAELLEFLRSLDNFAAGRLVERHTPNWRPLSAEEGGTLDLGHQFEWALLLSDWHAITGDAEALRQGLRFLHTGLDWGTDVDGGVWESCDPAGQPISMTKGLWQQCEAIRALRRYAVRHGEPGGEAATARTLAFYQRHFVDLEHGGVFARPAGLGGSPRLDKGDAWKLDYHSVNMCLELMA